MNKTIYCAYNKWSVTLEKYSDKFYELSFVFSRIPIDGSIKINKVLKEEIFSLKNLLSKKEEHFVHVGKPTERFFSFNGNISINKDNDTGHVYRNSGNTVKDY